jgi:benzoyl-CoA 2,3-epoxidase subunit B
LRAEEGRLAETTQPALVAINEILREEYIRDSARGVARWNRIIKDTGIDFQLQLPHRAFNRSIGEFARIHVSPEGEVLSAEAWEARKRDWMPTSDDLEFVRSLMKPARKPGAFASWIALPARGINHQPIDFEYVRLPAEEH